MPKLPLKVQPPSEIMQQIEAAIKYRNAVVHRGKSPPDREYLGGMLRAISDFLWMCDVYLGEVWAVRYVSFEMQKKWRIRS